MPFLQSCVLYEYNILVISKICFYSNQHACLIIFPNFDAKVDYLTNINVD